MSTQEVIRNQEIEMDMPNNLGNNVKAKRAYSAMGLRLTVYGILYLGLQFVYDPVVKMIFGEEVVYAPWYTWLMIIIPSYVIAFPIFAFISKNVEKFTIEKRKIGFGKYLCCILMDAGICGVAIITSGLAFGLFHGNFSQFFFATGLGMFFAYLYIRTGKIGYTIGLHMVINLCTSVITLGLLQNMDMDLVTQMSLMDPASP